MTHQPKILVAGYGPWAKAECNPAAQVLEELKKRNQTDCELFLQVMPVRSAELYEAVDALLEQHRPDAWVGLGVSGAGIIQSEMIGINWRHFGVPDASGAQVVQSPVLDDGPAAYNATLPNSKMVEAVNQAGIPAAVSFHAGTHLCNQMLYTAEHLIKAKGLSTLSGFIHVPQTPRNIAMGERQRPQAASMSLPMIADAISICLSTLANELRAQQSIRA